MSAQESETAHIKSLLKANAEQLARELLPDGHRGASYWLGARNPSRDDHTPGSFWVWIGGDRAGGWTDAASGQKGDVFGLIQLVHDCDFPAARKWAKGWLGLDGAPAIELQRRAAAVPAVDPAAVANDAAKQAEAAAKLYRASKIRPFPGSPADRYLRGRGIDVRGLGRMPGILGWLPEVYHPDGGQRWPVMVAAFQNTDGQVAAVHRTWLSPDGSAKAPVMPARKIWPSFAGCVMRVWRGGSGMREADAEKHGVIDTLVLTEGVEDALSVALAKPDFRVWAAGSLGNLGNVTIPACVDRIIVCADNDWGKPQALQQMQKAVAKFIASGRQVQIARSHIGKDANDALMGGMAV